jgi:hypothetical protein
MNLYDDYIRKKSIIWNEYDIAMEVLDVEAKRVADVFAMDRQMLENSWFASWADISYRRRGRWSRSFRLRSCWNSLIRDLEGLGREPHTCLDKHNRHRVNAICKQAIQALDDEFIALLENERLKQEMIDMCGMGMSPTLDEKMKAGYMH